MIKICFIVSSLCNEGPVNVMYNIIQYMDFSIFDVSIITLVPEKETTRFQDFKALPVKIYQLADKKPLQFLRLFKALKHQMEQINPDMLHSHCPRSLYLMYFLDRKYHRIYTIHIYPGLQQQILYGRLKGNIIIRLNNFFTRRIDMPIGCADSIGELYKKNQGWNIKCIPNGCSLPLWNENLSQKEKLRREFGLQDGINYFIFIGRFSKEKNPDLLIKAFKQSKRKDIGLLLLGNGPLWNDLKKYANERIIMPGFRNNIYDYLIAADYYISASNVEGLANTILESMTIGLPMLLSNIPSHREVLSKTDQAIGEIFDNNDLQSLYEQMEKVLALDKKTTAQEIRKIFSQYYTARKMSSDYQEAYSDLFFKRS